MTDKNVRDAPDLAPEEKEVTMTTTKGDDYVSIHSDVGTVSRWLLEHEHSTVTDTREVDGEIVGVQAKIPRGCLKLQANPRKSAQFSQVISKL